MPDVARRHDGDRAAVAGQVGALRARGEGRIGFLEGAPICEAYGIPAIRSTLVATPDEAGLAARALGFPVALKIVSPDIPHKTEIGGVRLGLAAADEVGEAARAMLAAARDQRPAARIVGLLVQRMAPAGALEMLLGTVRDPQFGPTVTLGLGGIWVELVRDTATRLAPLGLREARAMIGELRMAPALRGARGRPPVDLGALAETVCGFAQIAVDVPEIAELEINPLLVAADVTLALDIRGSITDAAGTGGEAR